MDPVFRFAGAARIVYQNLDRLDESLRILDEALHLVVVCQVADDGVSMPALNGDVVSDFLGLGLVATMDDDDRPLARKPSRREARLRRAAAACRERADEFRSGYLMPVLRSAREFSRQYPETPGRP